MTRHRILRSLLICTAALATTNCAAIQRHFAWLHLPAKPAAKFEPKSIAPSSDVVKAALDDSFYGDAVKAIDRRDYGNALELLQAARERAPDDVRVMNAFGVVYDKLGRFDLSGRYYQQAAALDPGSTIVANNEAYSRVLQARAASHNAAPSDVQMAAAAPAPAPVIKTPAPVATTLAAAAPIPAPVIKTPAPAATTLAAAAPIAAKAAPVKPAPLYVLPSKSATIQTVSLQLQTLLSPKLPSAFVDRSAETVSAPAPAIAPAAAPVVTAAIVIGPKPAPLEVAANETVALESAANDQALDRESAIDTLQLTPETKPQPIAPAIARTLADADTTAPQMGRVVPDGPGRVKLVPGPRPTTLAYAPQSVMTLDGPAPRTAAQGPALLASNGRIVEVAPGVLRLEPGSHPTMVVLARAPGLTGYPLAVIDASGRVDGAKATITHLASLGWTARIAPPTPSREHSTIYYEAGDLEVAKGLARTLPIPVQLAACEQACRGVTLVVGADALGRTGRG